MSNLVTHFRKLGERIKDRIGLVYVPVLLFLSAPSQAQLLDNNNSDYSKMSEILPPPPNAAALTKFAGSEVNLSSGVVSKTVPLMSLESRGVIVPIGISYVSNGIKVNEYSSRVGIGWSFEAGGSISRVIYGKDDFLSTRNLYTGPLNPNEDDMNFTNYLIRFLEGPYDSQPDIFSFNFNGYSGKFMFDNNGNIVSIPISNLKIEYNQKGSGNPISGEWRFLITTPDGTKYYFGGDMATEETKKEVIGGTNFSNFSIYTDNVWHLKKIVSPSGSITSFSYEYFEQFYKLGLSQTFYKPDPYIDEGISIIQYNSDCSFYWVVMTGTIPAPNVRPENSRTKGYVLKEILASDGGKISINYTSNGYPDKLVSSIVKYNPASEQVKRIDLLYEIIAPTLHTSQYTSSTSLAFLNSIRESATAGSMFLEYKFDYYDKTQLPARLSFAQDHWGYYNGKGNSTLVPPPEDISLQSWFVDANANREPDPDYTVRGLLKEIEYPTGGKESIEYEPNTVSENKDINVFQESNQSVTGTTFNQYTTSTGSSFTINYAHNNSLYINVNYIGSGQGDPIHDGGRVYIVNSGSGQVVQEFLFKPNANTYGRYFSLSPGTYTLYVASKGEDVRTQAVLKYIGAAAPNMQDVNVVVGGMRVKRINTYSDPSAQPIIKRYYYGSVSNLAKSTARSIPKPTYFRYFEERIGGVMMGFCNPTCNPQYKILTHMSIHSATLNQMYIFNGGPVNYDNVTESIGGENFELGAIGHKYYIVPDLEAQVIRGQAIPNAATTNTSTLSGREIEQSEYKYANGQFVPVRKKEFTYFNEPVRRKKEVTGLVINLRHDISCYEQNNNGYITGPYPYLHGSFDASRYYISSFWSYLSEYKETHYDATGQPQLTTTNKYFYDNENNLMLSRSEVVNSKGETIKETLKYPHDFTATGNVYEKMVVRNMIAPVVEKQIENNGVILRKEKTGYASNWYGDEHLIAVSNIQTAVGTGSFENRFTYSKYDTYGNPLEVSMDGGAKISYIWDFTNNQPIAKIVDAPESDVAFSSFENAGKGNWTYSGVSIPDGSAPTGIRAYVLSASTPITKTGVSAAKVYLVSYWTKNNNPFSITGTEAGYPVNVYSINGWKYYEHKVANQSTITVSGAGLIDELRCYPFNSQMTSSTYLPMIGLSSQTDPAGRIRFFEYDELNRLILIRDLDKNIIKKYCYNYSGQTENCNIYYNTLQSTVFTRNNCGVGYTGGSITYTVPAGTYVSTISVQDANNKAWNDILLYGQSYTNTVGSCTPVSTCTPSNCTGEGYKCINGVCQFGVKVYTATTLIGPHLWQCTYHYEWSDGSWSMDYTEESPIACPI